MKVGYTEFSFGYAFTENLIRAAPFRPVGAPVFPNLVQEGQLGYDVRIDAPGRPLFFQYKIPELMKKRSAIEISQHRLPDIRVPFYRMPLMRKDLSPQHDLLIRLERRFPKSVYYATACLDSIKSFNMAYNSASVHLSSALFSPLSINHLPDNKNHAVAYRRGSAFAWVCSNPRKIPITTFEMLEIDIQKNYNEEKYQTLRFVAKYVLDSLLALASPATQRNEGALRERLRDRSAVLRERFAAPKAADEDVLENILVCREIAIVDFGLDFLIAQPRAHATE